MSRRARCIAALRRAGARCCAALRRPRSPAAPNPEGIQIGLSTDRVAHHRRFLRRRPDHLRLARQCRSADQPAGPLRRHRGARRTGAAGRGAAQGPRARHLDQHAVRRPSSTCRSPIRSRRRGVPQDITDPNSYRQLALGADNHPHASRSTRTATRRRSRNSRRRCASARRRPASTASASAACSSCRRACSAPRCRWRPTCRSARTRRAPSCSATASSSRRPRRSWRSSSPASNSRSSAPRSDHSFFYGVFAVALAMLTGWLGRLIFRRD